MNPEERNKENQLAEQARRMAKRHRRLRDMEDQVLQLKVDIDEHISDFTKKIIDAQKSDTADGGK